MKFVQCVLVVVALVGTACAQGIDGRVNLDVGDQIRVSITLPTVALRPSRSISMSRLGRRKLFLKMQLGMLSSLLGLEPAEWSRWS